MKRLFLAIVIGALVVGFALAQDASAPQNNATTPRPQSAEPSAMPQQQAPAAEPGMQPGEHNPQQTSAGPNSTPATAASGGVQRLAPGSVIPVELAKSIDAKKAKSGDAVVAKVTQDLKNNSGEVLLAKDTKFIGHVTESQVRNKEQRESQLGIAFDKAVTKNGEMQMPMSIQAVIAPPTMNTTNGAGTANDQSTSAPSGTPSNGMAPNSGRNSNGSANGAAPSVPSANSGPSGSDSRPQITGNTQGVIGFSDLKLASPTDASQGTVMTSDKNNVKLESGTMMLLRVNQ